MSEVVYALQTITDQKVMEDFIKRQDLDGCLRLIDILRYADSMTERRWLDVYSQTLKYNK